MVWRGSLLEWSFGSKLLNIFSSCLCAFHFMSGGGTSGVRLLHVTLSFRLLRAAVAHELPENCRFIELKVAQKPDATQLDCMVFHRSSSPVGRESRDSMRTISCCSNLQNRFAVCLFPLFL